MLKCSETPRSSDEVKRLGKSDSVERTREQTQIAFFWANDLGGAYEPPGQLLGVRMTDAGIVAWDACRARAPRRQLAELDAAHAVHARERAPRGATSACARTRRRRSVRTARGSSAEVVSITPGHDRAVHRLVGGQAAVDAGSGGP